MKCFCKSWQNKAKNPPTHNPPIKAFCSKKSKKIFFHCIISQVFCQDWAQHSLVFVNLKLYNRFGKFHKFFLNYGWHLWENISWNSRPGIWGIQAYQNINFAQFTFILTDKKEELRNWKADSENWKATKMSSWRWKSRVLKRKNDLKKKKNAL